MKEKTLKEIYFSKLLEDLENTKGLIFGAIEVRLIGLPTEREYSLELDFIPHDEGELESLIESTPGETLKKMGVRVWDEYNVYDASTTYLYPNKIIYLFPGEWYNFIPEGFKVVTINCEEVYFSKSKFDDTTQFGCLSYGFVRNF